MGTPAEMRPLGEHLAAIGLDATGVLLPGFGPDVVNLHAVDRQAWLDAAFSAWDAVRRRYPRSLLVGYSMGGSVALHLAAESPPDGLILIAPFWRMETWMARLLPLAKHVVRSVAPFEKANFDDPAVRAQLQGLASGIDLDDAETKRFLREEVRLPLASLDEVARLGRSAHKRSTRVHAPTLVIQGEADATVAPALTRELVARLPQRPTYVEVPGGHDIVRLDGLGGNETWEAARDFVGSLELSIQPKQMEGDRR
jgi:carboxylesterase